MKTNIKYVIPLAAVGVAMATACWAGPSIVINPPTVVVSAPPVVAVSPAPVAVPDSYVWDGTEYVGMVGDQYYYLGPGDTWVVMDSGRLHRFQTWQGGHSGWHDHMTHNTRYRAMAHAAHPQPMERASAPSSRSGGAPKPHVNPGQYGPP